MTRRWRTAMIMLLACGALLALGGCDKGEPPEQPHETTGLPFADTPDQLMANFETAYTDMNLDAYRDEVLADAYDFVLLPETVDCFGLLDGTFGHADELAITQKMFSGQPNEAGRVLADLEITEFQPQGGWLPVAETDSTFGGIPGALLRRYDVLMFANMQGEFRYVVQGMQIFCVAPDTVLHEGAPTPRYRLRGQIDLTVVNLDKATDVAPWGTLKALFR
jgi:hypothetical protein